MTAAESTAPGEHSDAPPMRGFWFSGTGRIETFSDAVFAIALTLLVLDLHAPPTGRFAESLLEEWPSYVAYLAAFLTIGTLWLNHHFLFVRVRVVDPLTLLLNLALLLCASLVPWPASLIAAAVRSRDHDDEIAAIVVYALLAVLVTAPWSALNLHLAHRPELLRHPSATRWMTRNAVIAGTSLIATGLAALLALLSPIAALVVLVAAPAGFLALTLRSAARERTG